MKDRRWERHVFTTPRRGAACSAGGSRLCTVALCGGQRSAGLYHVGLCYELSGTVGKQSEPSSSIGPWNHGILNVGM